MNGVRRDSCGDLPLSVCLERQSAAGAVMELIPSETSLVIAGAWNVAILNPTWVQKHGLEKTCRQAR
jgi:hypothetical protein